MWPQQGLLSPTLGPAPLREHDPGPVWLGQCLQNSQQEIRVLNPLTVAASVANGGAQVGRGEGPALPEAGTCFVGTAMDCSQELWSRFAGCEMEVTVPFRLQQGKHHSLIKQERKQRKAPSTREKPHWVGLQSPLWRGPRTLSSPNLG